MNEFKKHKKSDGIKWVAVTLAIILLATALTATITKGFKDWNPFGWFDKQAETPETPKDNVVTDGAGNELVSGKVYPLSSKMLFTAPTAEGTAASEGITLQATVLPVEASNKLVDWTVSFVDAASTWATGKTVTNYLTITPTADGSTTATIVCKAAFGEKIQINVTSRENVFARADCIVDYARRIESVGGSASGEALPANGSYVHLNSSNKSPFALSQLPSYGAFTLSDDFTVTASLKINPLYIDYIKSSDEYQQHANREYTDDFLASLLSTPFNVSTGSNSSFYNFVSSVSSMHADVYEFNDVNYQNPADIAFGRYIKSRHLEYGKTKDLFKLSIKFTGKYSVYDYTCGIRLSNDVFSVTINDTTLII